MSINIDNREGFSISSTIDGSIYAVGDSLNDITKVYRIINDTWSQLGSDIIGTELTRFGHSVSLSLYSSALADIAGPIYIAIGAPGIENDKGYVKVYKFVTETNLWEQIGNTIYGENSEGGEGGEDGDRFGFTVALINYWTDRNSLSLAIGAPMSNNATGYVKLYNYSTTDEILNSPHKFTGKMAGDYFGYSISMNLEYIAIGAPFAQDGKGTTSVYDIFLKEQMGDDINSNVYGLSGFSVSLRPYLPLLAIGAPYTETIDEVGFSTGGRTRIYFLQYDPLSWEKYGEIDGINGEHSGYSVSYNSMLAIGSPFKTINDFTNGGQIRIYNNTEGFWTKINEINGNTTNERVGYSVSIVPLSYDNYRVYVGTYDKGVSLYDTTIPIGNICFTAFTPILTDQGNIPIEQIKAGYHTMRNKPILAVTQSVYATDKYLVSLEKNCLGYMIPSSKTIVSMNHRILYQGKMIKAIEFTKLKINGVSLIEYKGEVLYNILLATHDIIMVNNMICESLDPNHDIAKLYLAFKKMDKIKRNDVIKCYNAEYKRRNMS